ncbi:Putative multidrug export ATP-binding/permease protein [Planctomycetes bacterium Poly30]|uniref:Multidrug export ATP-binding/permease protein n=1 Tax=Saltatorellus ferox TaxID=2528018 RepID=A0A518ENK5_9BACT|nr:Putative multidrug export ATP-binding/permease protein [Planctomycetes bacterium Poly30]
MKRLGDLYRLLRPHAAPYVLTLLMVVLLGTVSALLQKSAFGLLDPTWKVLFPNEEKVMPETPDVEVPGFFDPVMETIDEWKTDLDRKIIGDPETLAESVPQRKGALWRIGIIVGVMAILAAITQYVMGVLSSFVGLRMMVSLRMQLARHLMGLSMRYHSTRRFGDLLSRISSDVGQTTQVVQLILKDLVQEPLLFIVSMGLAFFYAPTLTLFVLLGLPLFIVPIAILLKKVRRTSHKSATQLGSTFQVLTQMFQGVRTVKAYRAEERELARFQVTNDHFVDATMGMVKASELSRAWTVFITNFGIAAVVVMAGYLVLDYGLDAGGGGILAFFLMISQASSHLKRITRVTAQISEAQGPARRLLELMAETSDVSQKEGAVQLTSIGSGIRFEDVVFEYPEDEDGGGHEGPRFALRGIDLHVQPGETLALVGPSGSGKSTLVDLVARFVDPTEGRVTIDGHDLRDVSFDSLCERYALVTQAPFLFHATIAENIRYGKPAATQAEVEAAARAANIHDFIVGLADGYDTDVKDAGTRLSGGQRQRITIARALLRDPELLLLDEATSALDTESEVIVQEALEEMMVGRTTIVIAHRLSTIRNADRIAVLDQGQVVELGTHAELLEKEGVYARLCAAQAVDR